MNLPLPPDLQQLIADQLASGRYACEEDVLREALRTLCEADEDLAAVREAAEECARGDLGVPLSVAFAEIRRGTPARPHI